MKKITLLLSFLLCSAFALAQEKVSGTVTDKNNAPLVGVSIAVKGTTKSTSTDFDGKFSINAKNGDILVFTYVGLETTSVGVKGNTINVSMAGSGESLQDVVILGSRSRARTVTESAVPIDVINMKDIAVQGAQANLNQIMNMVAPSFTSNTQTVADGTDHIDPAQLRGLGPDQVLVLINGKRRHTSSLVNVNGTPGRGAVGTDLNAIPAFAVEKIEVLRDGASAQYGSDAIAGVINLGMKKATGKFEMNVLAGSHVTEGANDHRPGNDGNNVQVDMNYGFSLGKEKSFLNATASFQVRDITSRAKDVTNTIFNGYNAIEERARFAGVNINALFGNISNTPNSAQIINLLKQYAPQVGYFTTAQRTAIANANTIGAMQTALNFDTTDGELAYRGLTRRAFNMRVGQSSLESAQFFLNGAYPINENVELYAFGGYSQRSGDSAGFYRRPNQPRSYTGVYTNGFLPEIHSDIRDISGAAGVRGKVFGDWNFDFSNTYGQNTFDYNIENTINTTLRENSPTEFDAGGLGFTQNTTNLDVTKKIDKLNLAFGLEHRRENYTITPGQPESYLTYDINGNTVTGTTPANQRVTDFFGGARPGGSQVFPGFREANRTDKGRSSSAAYVDVEYDITSKWLVNGALRFENFTDFGNTLNYKIATLYKVADNFNLRGAISTGFRAPSLHQQYFNSTATQFVGGVPFEVGTFSNDSQPAQILGIPQLKQEESQSISAGFTAKIPAANLTITADAYQINIADRVVLTDQFARPGGTPAAGTPAAQLNLLFDQANATAATFFANAIDTKSRGIDVVISHKLKWGTNRILKTDLAATYSQTRQDSEIKGSDLLRANGQINRYFSEMSRIYLEEAVPRVKGNLTHTLTLGKVDLFLRNVYFGEVTDPNTVDVNGDGFIGAKIVNGQAVEDEHPIWGGKTITDFSVAYNFSKSVTFVIGANNIFDIYPDLNFGPVSARRPNGVDATGNVTYAPTPAVVNLSNENQFVYSRNVSQFGQNGRFMFARLNLRF